MTHRSKTGVPGWKEQIAAARAQREIDIARILKKKRYVLEEPVEPQQYAMPPYQGSGMGWYMPFPKIETKWLSEEEATLWRIKGYRVTLYEQRKIPPYSIDLG